MMIMLPLTILLVGTSVSTVASPAPGAAPPTKLQEIGRVRSQPICAPIVVHANSAIGDAIGNDGALTILQSRLRNADYDGANVIVRRKMISEFTEIAKEIRESSLAGDAEVKRLRELASASADATRKGELKAFADALGGALARQKKIALDLDKAMTVYDGRLAQYEAHQEMSAASNDPQFRPHNSATFASVNATPTPLPLPLFNPMMRDLDKDLNARLDDVAADEGIAADHSIGATTGC